MATQVGFLSRALLFDILLIFYLLLASCYIFLARRAAALFRLIEKQKSFCRLDAGTPSHFGQASRFTRPYRRFSQQLKRGRARSSFLARRRYFPSLLSLMRKMHFFLYWLPPQRATYSLISAAMTI